MKDIFGDPLPEEEVEIREKKPKAITPFDWIKYIQTGQLSSKLESYLSNDLNSDFQGYVPFIINRGLSLHPDTLIPAVEANMYSHLDVAMQFDFLFSDIKKEKRRYVPWPKEDKITGLEAVQKLYNYNHSKAMQVLNLVSSEELKAIEKTVNELVQNNIL